MTPKQKLTQLYPTLKSLNAARSHYKSWQAMADALNIHRQALYDHRTRLNAPTKAILSKSRSTKDQLTDKEIQANIKKLFGDEIVNVVTVYKTNNLDELLKNPCGDEFLTKIGTEQGGVWDCGYNPSVRGTVSK